MKYCFHTNNISIVQANNCLHTRSAVISSVGSDGSVWERRAEDRAQWRAIREACIHPAMDYEGLTMTCSLKWCLYVECQ